MRLQLVRYQIPPVRHSCHSTVGPNTTHDLRHYTDLLQVALPAGARSPYNPVGCVEGPEPRNNSSALVGTNNPSSRKPLCLAEQTLIETLNLIRQEPMDAESVVCRTQRADSAAHRAARVVCLADTWPGIKECSTNRMSAF